MSMQRLHFFGPGALLLILLSMPCPTRAAPVDAAVDILKKVNSGVVRIDVLQYDAIHHYVGRSSGSGFLIDQVGHFVTNNHVVAGVDRNSKIQVTLYSGIQDEASLVARDELSDLAVLEVHRVRPAPLLGQSKDQSYAEDWGLTPLKFAAPGSIQPGQHVLAIGFALGLEGMASATHGIVSATGRFAPHGFDDEAHNNGAFILSGLVQTDAAINHGNSGGPLVNFRGEVIGVNTLGASTPLDPETLERLKNNPAALGEYIVSMWPRGIGYAISSEWVEPIARRMIADHKLARAFLGVKTTSISQDQLKSAEAMWIFLTQGALVKEVEAGSPAAAAGIEPGDIINHVGKRPIFNEGDLNNVLALSHSGEKVTIDFRKNALKVKHPVNPGDAVVDMEKDYKSEEVTLK